MIRLFSVLVMVLLIITLNAQVTLQGKVMDAGREPVQGAHITCNDLTTISDLDGIFTLVFQKTGRYRLEVKALGFETTVDTVNLESEVKLEFHLREQPYDLQLVKLSASWIKPGQPFTYAQLNKEEIKTQNIGRDMPYVLQNLPSTVVTSDAGTGIGYTGIRIRGSDPTRINVTIDGVPVNDAESHGVFWVDLPDLASNAGAIQVQRGVGTSTNGAGAFGATINIKTSGLEDRAYGSVDLSGGSFGTQRINGKFGTGLLGDRFSLQGSLSQIKSDGYIDRASANLHSIYLSGTYLGNHQSLKFNFLRGKEITYQAWNGVPAQYLADPKRRTFNTAGLKSDGTFHDNEVDNYGQTHLHGIYHRQWQKVHLQATGHYTRGIGYFEQYRSAEDLPTYGLFFPLPQDDLIRRRWLDNHFYGVLFSVTSSPSDGKSWNLGGGTNEYQGHHFGEIIWLGQTGEITPTEYYRNFARKRDVNLYSQYEFSFKDWLKIFTDIQWRGVFYQFEGLDSDLSNASQKVNHHFINPKLGAEVKRGNFAGYYSVGVAHREPNRDDYTQSSPTSRPSAERLIDHELGGRHVSEQLTMNLNFFYMDYQDQLVLTGAINDVGEYNRVNVPESYRMGMEYSMAWKMTTFVNLGGSLTWNQSRIRRLTAAIDDWDTGLQTLEIHRNVPISFSPERLASVFAEMTLFRKKQSELQTRMDHRLVSKQYLDNTGNDQLALAGYHQTDLNISWTWYPRQLDKVTLRCQLINLFDQAIVNNGWVYRFISNGYDATPDDPHATRLRDGTYTLSGYYPQAGIHAFVGLSVTF